MERWLGNAIVAGGAVRDTLLGRPVKDIDVFHDLVLQNTNDLERVLPRTEAEEIEHRYDSKSVWNLPSLNIDFIYVGSFVVDGDFSDYIHEHFRCNLSKVWYDAGTLHFSPEFIRAVATQTLEFRTGTAQDYIDKICAKYPEFGVEIV